MCGSKGRVNPESDVYKPRGPVTMGANFSRHSSKGMSGRRCQSISNICNSKDHYMDPSNREIDAAYKFCNSLPSPNGTACNNNHEHKPVTKKTSLPNRVSTNEIPFKACSFCVINNILLNLHDKPGLNLGKNNGIIWLI